MFISTLRAEPEGSTNKIIQREEREVKRWRKKRKASEGSVA